VSRRAYAPIDSSGAAEQIVAALQAAIERHIRRIQPHSLRGIAFGFPGPFDYPNGVSYIRGVQKYESIYSLDLRAALRERLGAGDLPIVFRNDAEAAIVGEARYGAARGYDRLIGLTLGTGLGSAFLELGAPVRGGERVPPNGELYAERYRGAMADDLFLIPNGTIHCSGAGSLVLEISATPYIFTFKMYDWLRLGLDGAPRPLNIERAFENLRFERRGARVRAELISQPALLAEGVNWRIIHLPTHPDHFYDVRRLEFSESMELATDGDCHVMSLVEGQSIVLETADGMRQRFNYAETFVVPAAATRYRLVNEGGGMARVVQAYVKRAWLNNGEVW
jgi:hypothetical protein